MSITYMGYGWKLDLEPTELLVYLAITDHVDDDGEGCYASYDKLAAKTNLARSTVIRTCQKLEVAGILVHQGTHPQYGTNVWNIDKDKLPFKKPARNTRAKALEPVPGKRQKATAPSVAATQKGSHSDTPKGLTVTLGGSHSDTSGGLTVRPNPLDEPLVEPLGNHTGSGAEPPPPAVMVVLSDDDIERVPVDESGNELTDAKERDRPETALQVVVAQLTNSKYLTPTMKGRLRDTVTAVWGDNKRPVTHPSPEDQWVAHPDLFAEYVELCARRIREESGRSPSREALITSIRGYARYNTGWLDFKKAAQEEQKQAQQRADPSAKQNQWYYDPTKPDWCQ